MNDLSLGPRWSGAPLAQLSHLPQCGLSCAWSLPWGWPLASSKLLPGRERGSHCSVLTPLPSSTGLCLSLDQVDLLSFPLCLTLGLGLRSPGLAPTQHPECPPLTLPDIEPLTLGWVTFWRVSQHYLELLFLSHSYFEQIELEEYTYLYS